MRKLLLAAVVTVPFTAFAQAPTSAEPQEPKNSNVLLQAPGLLPKKPKGGLPDVKASPLAWPRLDPGAVICRSPDDLSRLAARRRGEPVVGSLDCQVTRAMTPVTILERRSPGLTQIKTNDPAAGGTGWTDVWLPEKAPVSARR